jgi:predicted acylesterase/phospholipase RssA
VRAAISNSLALFKWIFWRLPGAFSIPFFVLTIWWFLMGFRWAEAMLVDPLSSAMNDWVKTLFPIGMGQFVNYGLGPALNAVVVLGVFLAGLLIFYNLCAGLNWLAVSAWNRPLKNLIGQPTPAVIPAADPAFAKFQHIGIVLAGGGAKGAFQAGAMKAIYRFLEEKGALNRVEVIAGTSIGSWNALFWLANLIKPANGNWDEGAGGHEVWWRSVNAKMLAPDWYVPFMRNSFLSTGPWRRLFDLIFAEQTAVASRISGSDTHFYLTRSNVQTGGLYCATNNPKHRNIAGVKYDQLASNDPRFMAKLKAAVFASMDLPPLFPYYPIEDALFEDGGVIDNLPIQFAAVQGCDLIFILPLTASFEENTVNGTSVAARLMRVIDVRQGALERSGFTMLYLYNELAAMRQALVKTGAPLPADGLVADVIRRNNPVLTTFAICPESTFVNNTIGTEEFWKTKEAARAFSVMYKATWNALQTFDFDAARDRVRLALVSAGENVTWKEDF